MCYIQHDTGRSIYFSIRNMLQNNSISAINAAAIRLFHNPHHRPPHAPPPPRQHLPHPSFGLNPLSSTPVAPPVPCCAWYSPAVIAWYSRAVIASTSATSASFSSTWTLAFRWSMTSLRSSGDSSVCWLPEATLFTALLRWFSRVSIPDLVAR